MLLRGARRTADAIATCPPAKKDDDIPCGRTLTHDLCGRCGTDDRADLHAFGEVALVVDLAHLSRCKCNLVAVGAVPLRCAERDFLLRELSGQRLLNRCTRVGCARHAHRLIDVGTPRERIADGAAETGRRTAERLDLRRVVVRLVLEHEEPVLIFSIHIDGHADAARIDFLGLIEILQLALCAQRLHPDDGDVHERHIAFVARIDRPAVIRILLIGLDDRQ